MFITTKYSGYNRHGEQSAAGLFLILMQPKSEPGSKYPSASLYCHNCGMVRDEHNRPTVPSCPEHGIVARIRALDAAKHTNPVEYERLREAWGNRLPDERFIDGCAACDAYKEYASHCNYFQPAAIMYPLRAIVRYVRMRQLGHFMMGSARVGKTRLSLSGSYGSDGLPTSVPDEVYEMGTPLPQELYDAWNKGGGWNSAGSEADAMRKWAKENLIRSPTNHRETNENDRHRRERQAMKLNQRRKERYGKGEAE